MMFALVLVAVAVWVLLRRSKRARLLAGLVATRPTFMVEPPGRRLGKRSLEQL